MKKNLKAVYEHGVLRPLEPLDLPEFRQVTLTIVDEPSAESHQSPESCYELAQRLGLLGAVRDQPSDLSTNRKYFDGLGE